jgi:WhiB family transcriptional regulator, redox-sensing transcriptional regulator
MLHDTEWMDRASCKNAGPVHFFSYRTDADEDTAAARETKETYCKGCVVKGECLNYALLTHQRHGIWGGMTERERTNYKRSIAAKRRRQAKG